MKPGVISALIVGLALTTAAYGQAQNPGSSDNQAPNPAPGGQYGPGGGMGRGGGYGPGGFAGVMGRSVAGKVTAVAGDHYTIKTFGGQTYTVNYSANTRMMKQPPGMGGGRGYGGGGGQGRRGGGNPPQQIQASEIKVGDSIAATGEIDSSAKSVGAVGILLLDPARAQQIAQMEADYGKTWLMGRVTAIDGTNVTVQGGPDNASHTFTADENTTFRMRRNPITLADVKVGDMVRAEGAVKNGVFTATMVNDIGTPGQARVPRNGPPAQ